METYCFCIAGITVRIAVDWPVRVPENFPPFFCPPTDCPQEDYTLTCSRQLPEPDGPVRWDSVGNGRASRQGIPLLLRRLSRKLPPYYGELVYPDHRACCYTPGELPLDMDKVFRGLPFEDLLLRRGAMILHCSLVRWQNTAILFSAPSGTGKSTQAELWERYAMSETLNGDRAILRKAGDRWTAWGLPMAGSSDIFRNESAPIRALVMLKQGPENEISRLSVPQALRLVYPELSLFRHDSEKMEKSMDLILNFLEQVPAYCLSCRPDREAVELLRRTLTTEV